MIDRTQQELSEFFGVTRPSLARALGEMEKEGLIPLKDMRSDFSIRKVFRGSRTYKVR